MVRAKCKRLYVLIGGVDTFLFTSAIANHAHRYSYPGMSYRSSVVVMIWAGYFALGIASLAQHHYWFAAIWLGLGVVWFFRGRKASTLDDLSSKTLGLDSTPGPQSPFNPKRILI
jgi:hypothetical protein